MPNTPVLGIQYPETQSTLGPLAPHFAALAQTSEDAILAVRKSTSTPVASVAERGLVYPTPVQGDSVFRLDRGYVERYYDEYSSTGNPGGKTPADWYPDGTATLPAPVRIDPGAQSPTGTSTWTTLAWTGYDLVLPAAAWVDLDWSMWIAVTGASNDARGDLVVSGATTVNAASNGWGSVAYGNSASGTSKSSTRKIVRLNAGTNKVRVAGYRTVTNSGTFQFSYNNVQITPLRWA